MSVLSEISGSRELLKNLTMREVKGKYKRSVLGQTWSLINPIAMLAIYSVVFGFVLKAEPAAGDPSGLEVFVLWLACALLPWNFFSATVTGGMNALIANGNLIQKVHFPRWTLVVSTMAAAAVNFGFELVALVIAIALFGGNPWIWIPGVLIIVVLLALFGLGIALALSVANVYFRDTAQFVGIFMQIWFYATPIVYPLHLIRDKEALWAQQRPRLPARDGLRAQPDGAVRLRVPQSALRQPLPRVGRHRLLLRGGGAGPGPGRLGLQPLPGQDRGGTVTDIAVQVTDVAKRFRLYRERNQSLKAALMRGKRAAFEEFWALQDVSFDIPTGSTFGLIGENGSGKSTMLKCIARILEPDRGSVTVNGRIAALLELGSGFHPELSGRENVYLNGSILGLTKRELDAKFDSIVDFSGIEEFIDQPVKNYSSGMYVRLGFAVAINVDPDILLVDEVLAVGDSAFQEKCMDKFAEFRRQGKTVVIVSHAMGSLRSMCDNAVWLEHGRVIREGKATEIVDGYIDASHHSRADTVVDTEINTDDAGGSGEVKIVSVDLLDDESRRRDRFRTGDRVTVRVSYEASEHVPDAVFGLALENLDGVYVWAHNTEDAGTDIRTLTGSGAVELVIPALPLQPGTFELTAAITNTSSHLFHVLRHVVRFHVDVGNPRESGGVVTFSGRWQQL